LKDRLICKIFEFYHGCTGGSGGTLITIVCSINEERTEYEKFHPYPAPPYCPYLLRHTKPPLKFGYFFAILCNAFSQASFGYISFIIPIRNNIVIC